MKNSYYLFKLEIELMGIDTYGRDYLVRNLYNKYLKENQSDYRKKIGRFVEVSFRNRRRKC